MNGFPIEHSKEDFERQQKSYSSFSSAYRSNIYKCKTKLKICAPLKDMKMEGYKKKGRELYHIPDPVVLAPIKHSNGTMLYCIITAWGDEASDPIVVNQNNN